MEKIDKLNIYSIPNFSTQEICEDFPASILLLFLRIADYFRHNIFPKVVVCIYYEDYLCKIY